MVATFLALGESTNFLRFGFLRYWQRQGFCSLIFEQQSFDGGVDDVIALTHELSCTGLHVTAFDTFTSAAKIIIIITVQSAIRAAFIFTPNTRNMAMIVFIYVRK